MLKTQLYNKLLNYDFKSLFEHKGYAYFDNGNYNLNIIGVRSENKNNVTNQFDDFIVVIYNTPTKHGLQRVYPATTEPGLTVMKKPQNYKGTAILVPGQYRGMWRIDSHRGKYKALCQRTKPVLVYRDNNKDDKYDLLPEKIDKGIFGINLHKASSYITPTYVNNYSAGCQVLQNVADFNTIMGLASKQVANGFGNSFTYTLLTESELV